MQKEIIDLKYKKNEKSLFNCNVMIKTKYTDAASPPIYFENSSLKNANATIFADTIIGIMTTARNPKILQACAKI